MTDSVCFLLKLLDFKAACLCISELTAGETLFSSFFLYRQAINTKVAHRGQEQYNSCWSETRKDYELHRRLCQSINTCINLCFLGNLEPLP